MAETFENIKKLIDDAEKAIKNNPEKNRKEPPMPPRAEKFYRIPEKGTLEEMKKLEEEALKVVADKEKLKDAA